MHYRNGTGCSVGARIDLTSFVLDFCFTRILSSNSGMISILQQGSHGDSCGPAGSAEPTSASAESIYGAPNLCGPPCL